VAYQLLNLVIITNIIIAVVNEVFGEVRSQNELHRLRLQAARLLEMQGSSWLMRARGRITGCFRPPAPGRMYLHVLEPTSRIGQQQYGDSGGSGAPGAEAASLAARVAELSASQLQLRRQLDLLLGDSREQLLRQRLAGAEEQRKLAQEACAAAYGAKHAARAQRDALALLNGGSTGRQPQAASSQTVAEAARALAGAVAAWEEAKRAAGRAVKHAGRAAAFAVEAREVVSGLVRWADTEEQQQMHRAVRVARAARQVADQAILEANKAREAVADAREVHQTVCGDSSPA
jgi:hypothetical protein